MDGHQGEDILCGPFQITDRQNLVLPVKSDKTSLEGTTVKVYLTNGSFSEKFEVPVKETQNKRP